MLPIGNANGCDIRTQIQVDSATKPLQSARPTRWRFRVPYESCRVISFGNNYFRQLSGESQRRQNIPPAQRLPDLPA